MKARIFWVYCGIQLVGVLSARFANVHSNVIALFFFVVFLFPGYLLAGTVIHTPLMLAIGSAAVNLGLWYLLRSIHQRFVRQKTGDIQKTGDSRDVF